MLLDRAQDDAELLEGVEQLPNQLPLFELVLGRPDHRGHRIDHDAGLDLVVGARLHELRELLLDHLFEVLPLEMDEEEVLLVVLFEVEPHQLRLPHDLVRGLLEAHVQPLLPVLEAVEDVLDCERRLPRAARADEDDARLVPEAALDQVVEPRDAAADAGVGHVGPSTASGPFDGRREVGRRGAIHRE